jgi:hypothetical protein
MRWRHLCAVCVQESIVARGESLGKLKVHLFSFLGTSCEVLLPCLRSGESSGTLCGPDGLEPLPFLPLALRLSSPLRPSLLPGDSIEKAHKR